MKGLVGVRMRQSPNASSAVGAAATAIWDQLKVRPFLSPEERSRQLLALGWLKWAEGQPLLSQQCHFSMHKGVVHVKAGPSSGRPQQRQAPAAAGGGGGAGCAVPAVGACRGWEA